ncbi:hypothetical protein [Mesorhizobium xinjiangense]|uniref:hypothetical protein n=1 Tax=Mesorhizobium xinjiangense TaxID=2678685 RepID=UPI0012ED9022|nr:hypothetical protein [Mesorhizobium xinjiangense]
MQQAADQDDFAVAIGRTLALRTFTAFAALAVLSLVVGAAGHWFGQTLSEGGHTSDIAPKRIIIGANMLSVPANAIRFASERRNGAAQSVHLYVHWPDMEGYRPDTRDAFNHTADRTDILFLSLRPQTMSRDMSGRLAPVYRALMDPRSRSGPAGLAFHDLKAEAGYDNEMLVIGPEEEGGRFVARCLTGPLAGQSLAGCERDILIGTELSLAYRFHEHLLKDWRALDAAVRAYAARLLDAGR